LELEKRRDGEGGTRKEPRGGGTKASKPARKLEKEGKKLDGRAGRKTRARRGEKKIMQQKRKYRNTQEKRKNTQQTTPKPPRYKG